MKKVLQIALMSICALLAVSCAGKAKGSGSGSAQAATSSDNYTCSGVIAPAAASDYMHNIKVLNDATDGNGVRRISVEPSDVCSVRIDVAVKDGVIVDVTFTGGCPGNTTGVCRLVKGMKVTDAISKLEGIDCGGKGTSCPDQLAHALMQIKAQQ